MRWTVGSPWLTSSLDVGLCPHNTWLAGPALGGSCPQGLILFHDPVHRVAEDVEVLHDIRGASPVSIRLMLFS